MPRNRSKAQQAQHETEVPNTNTQNGESRKMASELSLDQINDLLANTKSRGEYAEYLSDFVKRAVAGEEVDLTEGILAGKSVDKAYTGLTNAQKAQTVTKDENGVITSSKAKVQGAEQVKVIRSKDKEHVFLINRALVTA